MIVVTFSPARGKPIHGIMLQRDAKSNMIEVAFDQTDLGPMSIGWINPIKQKILIRSNFPVRWRHRALRLIEAKNVVEARTIFAQEEHTRKQERIRKEQTI